MEINENDKPFMQVDSGSLSPESHSVVHCVHLQMKDGYDQKQLTHLLTRARARIPGLIELHFGQNDMKMYKGKNEEPAGNTHALVSRHVNANALSVYQKHPDHVALARFIYAQLVRPPTVVDFVNMPSKL